MLVFDSSIRDRSELQKRIAKITHSNFLITSYSIHYTKLYDIATAVDGITFSCEPGRVFSLLGPNGAGKTTTLRMISTIFKPTSGSIKICGIDAVQHPKEARGKIGFLTGSTGLYARLTPVEMINYFADLYGVEKQVREERKERLFELLDMKDFLHKRIGKNLGRKNGIPSCCLTFSSPRPRPTGDRFRSGSGAPGRQA